MRAPLTWLTGAGASLAAHAAILGIVVLNLRPNPMPRQDMPAAKIDIAAYKVDRTEARPQDATGDAAAASSAAGTSVAGAAIPTSVAKAEKPAAQMAQALSPPTQAVKADAAKAPVVQAAEPAAKVIKAAASPADATIKATPAALDSFSVKAAPAPAESLPGKAPEARIAAAMPLPQQPTAPAPPDAPAAPSAPATGSPLAQSPASAQTTAAPQVAPTEEHATASLAWVGDKGEVDPVSLAAIQAFMQPGDTAASASNAGKLRDGIEQLLASVPCSRLQTSFDPATGTLELRGHVPDDALRGPVLAALREKMGDAIKVSDKLLILPRPQCGALEGIANVGLPQSTEQDTNPRVIGPDAYVREYRYTNGQRLTLDMTAPDYPSVIYVDYFDANGMVIHLQPNSIVPLDREAPKSVLSVGRESAGKPALNITISPPYGQEIAVAFSASAPLYDGLRQMTEPAGPYLEFLRDRVAAARAADPGFKGEWVYFFISTSAG